MDVMPKSMKSEQSIFTMLKEYDLKPDIDILNGLIRQRIKRTESITSKQVKDVLALIGRYELSPDSKTFEIMSRGCSNHRTGLQLLKDMEVMDIAPDKQIMEHLIRQSGEDFRYRRSLI